MKWGIKILTLLLFAWIGYYATISLAPASILAFLKVRAEAEWNAPIYSEVISEVDRKVPLPNPDFLYVAVAFDISEGPVLISGKMPDSTYYSVAFYEMNTRNFYIRNDRNTPEKEFSMVLARGEDFAPPANSKHEWVEAPGSRGAILVRILVTDPEQIPYLQGIQHSFVVEEYR